MSISVTQYAHTRTDDSAATTDTGMYPASMSLARRWPARYVVHGVPPGRRWRPLDHHGRAQDVELRDVHVGQVARGVDDADDRRAHRPQPASSTMRE